MAAPFEIATPPPLDLLPAPGATAPPAPAEQEEELELPPGIVADLPVEPEIAEAAPAPASVPVEEPLPGPELPVLEAAPAPELLGSPVARLPEVAAEVAPPPLLGLGEGERFGAAAIEEAQAPIAARPAEAQARLEALRGEMAELSSKRSELTVGLAKAATDEEREKVRVQLAENREAMETVGAGITIAQGERDAEAQRAGLELEQKQERIGLLRMAQADEEARLAGQRLEADQRQAEADYDQAKQDYQRVLKERPAGKLKLAALMVAEAISAHQQKRTPNMSEIIAQHEKLMTNDFRPVLDAALERVAQGKEGLDRVAAQRAEAERQTQIRKAAIADDARLELERYLGKSVSELEKVGIAQALDAAAQEAETARQFAVSQQRAALEKARAAEVDRQLKEAQTAKTLAETERVQVETAKAARSVTGLGKAGTELVKIGAGERIPVGKGGTIPGNVVPDPRKRDTALVVFPATKEGAKEAATTRARVEDSVGTLDALARIERALEDASKKGILEGESFGRSQEWEDIKKSIEFMKPRLARVSSDGFATTEGDLKWAGEMLPKDVLAVEFWRDKDAGLKTTRALRTQYVDRVRSGLRANTRLNENSIADVIAASETLRVSQSDVAKKLLAEADTRIIDPSVSAGERAAAVRARAVELVKAEPVERARTLINLATALGEDDPARAEVKEALSEELKKARKAVLGERLAEVNRAAGAAIAGGRHDTAAAARVQRLDTLLKEIDEAARPEPGEVSKAVGRAIDVATNPAEILERVKKAQQTGKKSQRGKRGR